MDATVSTLVTQYSNGQADLTAAQEFYDDIMSAILANFRFLTNFNTGIAVTNSNELAWPTASVDLLMLFYANEQLGNLSTHEANFLLNDWRETVGPCKNYVLETSDRDITLCPKPSSPTTTGSMIFTETRQTLPTYLQLPVAFLILYYEYARESTHQDQQLAQAYKAMGTYLLQLTMYPEQTLIKRSNPGGTGA
jgi:hypothetical protein